MDTDPHFWMPMTLKRGDYVDLMQGKGVSPSVSSPHYDRVSALTGAFLAAHPELGLFGDVDVGAQACWWDYGLLKLYAANNRKIAGDDPDSPNLRRFLGIGDRRAGSVLGPEAAVDASSVVLSSSFHRGTVSQSVVACCQAGELSLDHAVVVNVTARRIVAGRGAVLYNLVDDSEEGLVVPPGGVRVGVFDCEGGCDVVNSTVDVDGGKVWEERVCGNGRSFEQVHKDNRNADILAIEKARTEAHASLEMRL